MKKVFVGLVTICVCFVCSIIIGQMADYYKQCNTVYADETTIEPVEETPTPISVTGEAVTAQALTVKEKVPSNVKKAIVDAKKKNDDVCAYLYVPAVGIKEIVLQSSDNADYLHKNKEGKYSYAGSVFADMATPIGSKNTILYGHNMRSGSMFGRLSDFLNKKTLKKNRYVYLYTENEVMKYEIFTCHTTTIKGNEYKLDFNDFSKFKKGYETNVQVSNEDNIITLSTCHNTNINKDNRLVVQAKLVD